MIFMADGQDIARHDFRTLHYVLSFQRDKFIMTPKHGDGYDLHKMQE